MYIYSFFILCIEFGVTGLLAKFCQIFPHHDQSCLRLVSYIMNALSDYWSFLIYNVFLLQLLCSGGWVPMLCILVLCRENQSLVRELCLSPWKMRRGNTCQDMSLTEEICFLQWDILWVAESTILQMLLCVLHVHVLLWLFSFLLRILKKGCKCGNYFETVVLGH